MPNRTPPPAEQPDDGTTHLRSDLRVRREVPLWAILSFVAGLGAQAVGLYYGQQALLEKVGVLTAEVKELRVTSQRYEIDRERASTVQADILRRLGDLERRVNGLQRP